MNLRGNGMDESFCSFLSCLRHYTAKYTIGFFSCHSVLLLVLFTMELVSSRKILDYHHDWNPFYRLKLEYLFKFVPTALQCLWSPKYRRNVFLRLQIQLDLLNRNLSFSSKFWELHRILAKAKINSLCFAQSVLYRSDRPTKGFVTSCSIQNSCTIKTNGDC